MDPTQGVHFWQVLRALQMRQMGTLPLLHPVLGGLRVRETISTSASQTSRCRPRACRDLAGAQLAVASQSVVALRQPTELSFGSTVPYLGDLAQLGHSSLRSGA